MNAYVIYVKELKKFVHGIDEISKRILLEYVPLGDNYNIEYDICDFSQDPCDECSLKNDDRSRKNFNEMICHYNVSDYFHNASVNLEEHFKRTHRPYNHCVVIHPHIFEKIKQIIDQHLPIRGISYKKCMYDSSKKETYQYNIHTHSIVNFLDSTNPLIQQWLDTMPIKGHAKYDKKELNPESLCKSTTLTLRQHLEMFKKDSKQCNFNTVNHGIHYSLWIYQEQFDLLKRAYLEYPLISPGPLLVQMTSVPETDAVTQMDKYREFLEKDFFDPKKHKKSPNNNFVRREQCGCEIS